jgi:hypothetical protein
MNLIQGLWGFICEKATKILKVTHQSKTNASKIRVRILTNNGGCLKLKSLGLRGFGRT